VDPACKTGSGNQCGIQIHEGTSCKEHADGQFWNEALVNSDPWTTVQYDTTNGTSQEKEGVMVISGLEREEILGHAVIVYDSVKPGRRIACALITTSASPEPRAPSGFDWWMLVVIVGAILGTCGIVGFWFYSPIYFNALEEWSPYDEDSPSV